MQKQTKAKAITRKTKEIVWQRQHGKSIFPPYREITVEMCCCHYVSRANGGIGEEWNIFGCYQAPWLDEHKMFDRQIKSELPHELMEKIIENHFKAKYWDWDKSKCKYQKYKSIKLRRKDDTD